MSNLLCVTILCFVAICSSLDIKLLPSSSFSCNVNDEGFLEDDRVRLRLEFSLEEEDGVQRASRSLTGNGNYGKTKCVAKWRGLQFMLFLSKFHKTVNRFGSLWNHLFAGIEISDRGHVDLFPVTRSHFVWGFALSPDSLATRTQSHKQTRDFTDVADAVLAAAAGFDDIVEPPQKEQSVNATLEEEKPLETESENSPTEKEGDSTTEKEDASTTNSNPTDAPIASD